MNVCLSLSPVQDEPHLLLSEGWERRKINVSVILQFIYDVIICCNKFSVLYYYIVNMNVKIFYYYFIISL